LLPNEEGDPYAYVQAIDMMRASIVGGNFTLSELFGFWLPLYQFICALVTVVVGHPLYVAKVVSALCGTGVCLLVFELSEQLTASRMLSLFAFVLIALNPIHVMYSAFSMSTPHALLVIGSLYFAIKNRWVLAAGWWRLAVLCGPSHGCLSCRRAAVRVASSSFGNSFLLRCLPFDLIYISWSATGNALDFNEKRLHPGVALEGPKPRFVLPPRDR
jgi:hypothetical protein